MQLFYAPDIKNEKRHTLSESESKHAVRVLRLKENDTIKLVDGKGVFFEAKILSNNPKKCVVEILKTTQEENTKPYLHIAIAPTKKNERNEWFVEKCTEIGINEITPILCANSERRNLKTERLIKTAVSAIKQSLKATLPKINEFKNFSDFLQESFTGNKFIAHCYAQNQKHYKDSLVKGENNLILIGPEGDFSKEEVTFAIENGFEPISLGNSRLRTETAGIMACSTFNLLNE